jgi:hypothetical protein
MFGQGWLTEENTIETNWNITFQAGPNLLLGELRKDFTGFSSNMTNTPGLGINIQLSKMVWERTDLGFETGYMNYKGINKNSSSINFLSLSEKFNHDTIRFLPYPVIYNSNIFNIGLYTKYNFINFSSYLRSFIKLNMFVRFGVGLAYLSSELGYEEKVNYELSGLSDPLFSTNETTFFERINGYINPAIGLNYQLNERIFFSAEMNFIVMNSSLIDGVYNAKDNLPPNIGADVPNEYSIPVVGIQGKFMLGCTYFFNFDINRNLRVNAFPWYNNRYRSYFSKYHNPASKRIIKERLPFYNNKLDE